MATSLTSRSVNDSPSSRSSHSLTRRYPGVVPTKAFGTQFLFPWTTCRRVKTRGARLSTLGHSRRIVSASSGVRVLMLPLPRLTPFRDTAPAWTTMLSTPVLDKSVRIAVHAPLPISAMATSDPTPMMMPSVVSAERMTLRRSERRAVEVVRAKNRMSSRAVAR